MTSVDLVRQFDALLGVTAMLLISVCYGRARLLFAIPHDGVIPWLGPIRRKLWAACWALLFSGVFGRLESVYFDTEYRHLPATFALVLFNMAFVAQLREINFVRRRGGPVRIEGAQARNGP